MGHGTCWNARGDSKLRVRFSIDTEAWRRACEYAELTHRTPSGFIAEIMDQYINNHPRKGFPIVPLEKKQREPMRSPRMMSDFKKQIEDEARWYQAKKATFERDDYTCQHCGASNTTIIPHHIKRKRLGGPDDPSNLVTLCQKCHGQAHSKKGIQF